MALYSKEDTKTFFTNIGGVNDVCYFCKKRLSEQYNKNSIPYDEMKDELKKLERKLISKRIVKIESLGLNICICGDCIKEIYKEMFPDDLTQENNMIDAILNSSVLEDKPEEKPEKELKKGFKLNSKKDSKKNGK